MAQRVHPDQGVLRPPITNPIAVLLDKAKGVARLEDLDWPHFPEERTTTLSAYAAQIGVRMADLPRASWITDEALEVFGQDFDRAHPANLSRGLYFVAGQDRRRRSKKLTVVVDAEPCDLDRQLFPGIVPRTTAVIFDPRDYDKIARSTPDFVKSVDAKTRNANRDNRNIEEVDLITGRSVVHALTLKKRTLSRLFTDYLERRATLLDTQRVVAARSMGSRRIDELEPMRRDSLEIIHDVAALACSGLGYGTTTTNGTLRALASNLHRVQDPSPAWLATTEWAARFYDAALGKINQSQRGINRVLGSEQYLPLAIQIQAEELAEAEKARAAA
jgi:hypothetical protein